MWWRLKSPALWSFTQPLTQAQIKENIKAPCHWPLWGEFTGHRWIPTKDQQRGKCFHLMRSSCGIVSAPYFVLYQKGALVICCPCDPMFKFSKRWKFWRNFQLRYCIMVLSPYLEYLIPDTAFKLQPLCVLWRYILMNHSSYVMAFTKFMMFPISKFWSFHLCFRCVSVDCLPYKSSDIFQFAWNSRHVTPCYRRASHMSFCITFQGSIFSSCKFLHISLTTKGRDTNRIYCGQIFLVIFVSVNLFQSLCHVT